LRSLRERRYGWAMSERRRGLGELFAAPLFGGRIRSDNASLVVVEWRDPGGGSNPPARIDGLIAALHASTQLDQATPVSTFREYASEYLGWP